MNLPNEMHKFHYEEPHGTLKSSNCYCGITTNTFYDILSFIYSFMIENKSNVWDAHNMPIFSLRMKPFMGSLFPYDVIALIDPGFVGFQLLYARHIKPSDPTDFSYRNWTTV